MARWIIKLVCSVDPEIQRLWAARLLLLSIFGWFLSHVLLILLKQGGFFEHVVMAISWLAITFTCWDIIKTSDVRAEQES